MRGYLDSSPMCLINCRGHLFRCHLNIPRPFSGRPSTPGSHEFEPIGSSFQLTPRGPAHIRYLVRRLRRILPQGTLILVCYWTDEDERASARELLQYAEADAYATSLPEAVELCVKAAKGELKAEEVEEAAASTEAGSPPAPTNPKGREPKRNSQSAVA